MARRTSFSAAAGSPSSSEARASMKRAPASSGWLASAFFSWIIAPRLSPCPCKRLASATSSGAVSFLAQPPSPPSSSAPPTSVQPSARPDLIRLIAEFLVCNCILAERRLSLPRLGPLLTLCILHCFSRRVDALAAQRDQCRQRQRIQKGLGIGAPLLLQHGAGDGAPVHQP